MNIIHYTQVWDFHKSYHVALVKDNTYIGSGYVEETSDSIVVNGIYINSEHRGKGYGYMLMSSLQTIYNQYSEVFLQVRRDNLKAIRLYEKFGFEFHQVAEGTGSYVWMRKEVIKE